MRLLIADDDRETAETLAELLGLLVAHAEFTLAFDGMELLEAALSPNSDHDVIIADIEMPRMDGASAAAMIRDVLGAATPKLIAVTGQVGITPWRHGVFDHVLLKPLNVTELLKLLVGNDRVGCCS